jgi:hypothetical protein
MSLPSSEALPTNIKDLPPARQRHIRRQPRTASPAERGILLDSLLDLTGPTLNFFLRALLGGVVFGLTLYFDEPALLMIGVVAAPFLKPLFGLALFPHAHKFSHWIKSLVSLLIPILLAFAAGALAGWLRKDGLINRLDAIRLSAPYWLDLAAVALTAFLCAFIMVREGKLPRTIGILLSYEILFPVALAGFGFSLGFSQLWPDALLIGLSHLLLAIFIAIITFLGLSFSPNKITGWIFALLPLIFSIFLLATMLNLGDLRIPIAEKPIPTNIPVDMATNTNEEKPPNEPSPTENQKVFATATQIPPTQTKAFTATASPLPSNTITPTSTPTPQPTTFMITIDSVNGVVIRESADFQAPVAGYANNGDQFAVLNQSTTENGSIWFEVQISPDTTGWLLGSLSITQTPIATENN